ITGHGVGNHAVEFGKGIALGGDATTGGIIPTRHETTGFGARLNGERDFLHSCGEGYRLERSVASPPFSSARDTRRMASAKAFRAFPERLSLYAGRMPSGTKWSRDELLVALNLYHKLTFGQMHARQPTIVALAKRLGRTSNSVAMKLCNLAS